jgi:hypothetical protein
MRTSYSICKVPSNEAQLYQSLRYVSNRSWAETNVQDTERRALLRRGVTGLWPAAPHSAKQPKTASWAAGMKL